MAARVVPIVAVLVLLVLPAGVGAQVDYSGTWRVSDVPGTPPGSTPWSDGGTLTIGSSSRSEVERFDNTGSVARPQCLGYPADQNVAEEDQPRVSKWYVATYSWGGGGQMGGCVSNKTGGQVAFFGSSSDVDGSFTRNGDGSYGGYWRGPGMRGSSGFRASKTAEGPPSGGNTAGCGTSVRPPACAILFGATAVLPVPAPEIAGDISTARLPAGTTEVEADVAVSEAEINEFVAVLEEIRLKRLLNMCVYYGSGGLEDELDDLSVERVSTACHALVTRLMRRTRTRAQAAGGRRCTATFVPLWRSGARPTARRRRAAVAAYRRVLSARCSSSRVGQLSIKLAAKRRRTPLNRLLGARAQARIVRGVSGDADDGPNAQMTVRWRRR